MRYLKPGLIFLLTVLLSGILLCFNASGQSNQTVNNGDNVSSTVLNNGSCTYTWTNSNPAIGLPASGSGNIPAFTAQNTGKNPITATITATPVSGFAYMNNESDGTVSVINIANDQVITTIPIASDAGPWGAAVSADGKYTYIANGNNNTISVISTATNTIVKTFKSIFPFSLCVSPDGNYLYVTNYSQNSVSVINTATGAVMKSIVVGRNPTGIAISPDGSRVYVTNSISATISVINTTSNTIATTITSPTVDPNDIAASPDGKNVYYTSQQYVYVINTATDIITKQIQVGWAPYGITVSPDSKRIYEANANSNTVSVIDVATQTIAATIPVGDQPQSVSLNSDGSILLVSNYRSNTVSVINTATNQVSATIPVGAYPNSLGNFIGPGNSACNGSSITFSITVKPTAVSPTVTATTAIGTIEACEGTPSSGTNIEKFTVSASNLQSDITVTAPAGFEVSLSSNTGYAGTVSIPKATGTITGMTVFVRSAAADGAGSISGTVLLSTPGAVNASVKVNGLISPLPTADAPASQTTYNGSVTAGIIFSGSANSFTWTNDTPSIGLAASGSGTGIPSFTTINNGTTKVTATITLTPKNTRYMYIADSKANTITVYDPAAIAIVGHIGVGAGPEGVSVSPDGKHVYVANYNDGTVSAINTSDNTIAATVAVGKNCYGIQVSADSKFVYVANYGSNNVSVIDATNNGIAATIPVGLGPQDLVLSPDGSKLYVTNYFSNNISIIDVASNKVTGSLTCGAYPDGITISPDGSFLYVAQENAAAVSTINIANNSIVATIPVGQIPTAIITSADGSKVYVASEDGSTVSVISTSTNLVTATINGGKFPTGLALSADGSILYIQDFQTGNMLEINTSNNQLITVIGMGAGADSFGNFLAPGMGCPGNSVTFTITVLPSATPSHNTSGVSGYITACQGAASVSPAIESFHVSGGNLTGDVTVTAPANFEVSLASNNGYSNTLSIPQSGGNVNNVPVYVRSAATAPAGKIYGNVVLNSPGAADDNVPVTGFISTVPTVTASTVSQTVTSGTFTTALNFTGSGNVYNWTNDQPSIGLAASGSGNIPSFPAINNGNSTITATITVTPQQIPYAYITNQQDNTVSVINILTNTVEKTIPVGKNPLGAAVSPDGTKVYITNQRDNTVSVISTLTNTVTSTIPLQNSSPTGVAVSPDGTKIFVVNLNSNSVSVIDAASGNVLSTYGVGGYPVGVTVSPDGSKVFVTNSSNNISVVDLTKNNVTTINAIQGPYDACTNPDGSLLYATNLGNNTVSVINLSTLAVTATIPVDTGPEGIAITPDGGTLYVANSSSGTVSVISTATDKVLTTINVGSGPIGVSVTSDGQFVYVTNQNSNSVSVINTSSNTVATTIPVGAFPESLGNFISPGSECPGIPAKFTITVIPTALAPTITAGNMSGNIMACEGSASADPYIGQFTVSGKNLNGDITVTAHQNFEVSLNAPVGYSNSLVIAQSGGNVSDVTIYVRSAANAPVGNIPGNIVLTSDGAISQNVAVTGVVDALPSVNQVANQTVTGGNTTATINFTGNTSIFNWTNDMPSIGLPVSGTGNILPFTAINNTSSPIKAEVTVTPEPSGNGLQCEGTPITFTITVQPSVIAQNIIIPNTFTPNGDGINDTWQIKSLENYPNCTVAVYNRWGEKLYSSVGYLIPWDGTYKGVYLPVGTYYYIINLKNGVNAISGWVAIVK